MEKILIQYKKLLEKIKENMKYIKYKIIVMSGKGGVGKSMVTANLATAFSFKKYSVAILDADLHGPSIPKMFGIVGEKLGGNEKGIIPVRKWGIDIVSLDFLIPSEEMPIIWRGPLKTKAIMQFLGDVYWNKKDILLIDLPPGTGDEALSIAQNIPDINGSIIVTIPSQVSEHVVKKAVTFSKKLNIPILGVIENMSYFQCPKCGEKYYLFGKNGGKMLAEKMKIRFLGSIPISPEISLSGDIGIPVLIKNRNSEISKIFIEIAENIVSILNPSSHQ